MSIWLVVIDSPPLRVCSLSSIIDVLAERTEVVWLMLSASVALGQGLGISYSAKVISFGYKNIGLKSGVPGYFHTQLGCYYFSGS